MVAKKQKSAVAYALLALFLGVLGIHKFYAGRPVQGLLMLGWIPLYIIGIICAANYAWNAAGLFYTVGTIWIVGVSIWAFVDMIIGFCHAGNPQKLFKK